MNAYTGKADLICGWGVHAAHRERHHEMQVMFTDMGVPMQALRWTQDGFPGHPLYVPYEDKPHPRPRRVIDKPGFLQ